MYVNMQHWKDNYYQCWCQQSCDKYFNKARKGDQKLYRKHFFNEPFFRHKIPENRFQFVKLTAQTIGSEMAIRIP